MPVVSVLYVLYSFPCIYRECKEELDETLTDCVCSFPVIYDPSKQSHTDRLAKDDNWKCVFPFLKMPVTRSLLQ